MFILIVSFPLGYAPNTITVYSLILFFFLDKKENIANKIRILLKSRLVLMYFIFFLIQGFGLLYSENIKMGISKTLVVLPFLFLPAIIQSEGKKYGPQGLYSALKIALPLVFVLMAFLYFVSGNYRGMEEFVQLWFVDRLGMSQFYLVFVLLLPIFFSTRDLNSNNILLNLLSVSVSAYFMLLMNNFSGLVFLVIALILFFRKMYLEIPRGYFLTILAAVILMATSVVFLNPRMERKFDPLLTTSTEIDQIRTKNKYAYTRNTLEHRLYIHYLVISDWKNNTPFGVGTGDTQQYLNGLYQKNTFLTGIKRQLNAHSQYLQEYLKTGMLGLVAILSLFFSLLWHGQRKNSVFFYYILFFVVACLIESYLNRYHGVIICSGIIPLLLDYKEDP